MRRDPVTGKRPAIMVSGNFRDAYNIFACISANPQKVTPIAYHIERNNGSAVSFVTFICNMIRHRWLVHDEILIMDNAAVHTGKEAKMVKDLLWETCIDGKPLHILVVYLPPRCPELNPIEKIFHVLSRRVRSFRHEKTTEASTVLKTATDVMNSFSYEFIKKTINSCHYKF